MAVNLETGDWVMVRPAAGHARWWERGILLSAEHTHDELLVCPDKGEPYACDVRPGGATRIEFKDRLRQVEAGQIVMAVFRWHSYQVEPMVDSMAHREFQETIKTAVDIGIRLRLQYDWTAILNHARNFIRAKLRVKWLPPVLIGHKEWRVFCTEYCFIAYDLAGIDMNALTGNQPLPAPCHPERLVRNKMFTCIKDYGLMRHLTHGR